MPSFCKEDGSIGTVTNNFHGARRTHPPSNNASPRNQRMWAAPGWSCDHETLPYRHTKVGRKSCWNATFPPPKKCPKRAQSMFVGADLTATKLGPKNFRKSLKNLLCDGDGDFCWWLLGTPKVRKKSAREKRNSKLAAFSATFVLQN